MKPSTERSLCLVTAALLAASACSDDPDPAAIDDMTIDDDASDIDDDSSDDDSSDDDSSDDDSSDDDSSDDDSSDDDSSDAGAQPGTDGGAPAPPVLTTCTGNISMQDLTVVDSDVTEDAEWRGHVYLTLPITIGAAATLTIAPGTHFVAAEGAGITVDEGAALVVDGKQDPVLGCGEMVEAGALPWQGIRVREGADARTLLSGLVLMDAGSPEAAALTLAGPATLDDVQVFEAAGDGIRVATAFGDGSTAVSVSDSAGRAVVLDTAAALASLPGDVELARNGSDRIHLAFAELAQQVTVVDPGAPFYQEGDLQVLGGELAIEAGVEWIFAPGAHLAVGSTDEAGVLRAVGTSSAPIVFRGDGEGKGSFEGIVVDDGAGPGTLLEHVEIRGGGANYIPPLAIRSPARLVQVTVRDGARAVEIDGDGLDPDSESFIVTASAGAPLYVAPNALVTVPHGDYTGNGEDTIRVSGGEFTTAGTIVDRGVPYFVTADIVTTGDSVFEVAGGVEFIMYAGTQLSFGDEGAPSTVIIDGTEANPVVFSAVEDMAGYWNGIVVGENVTPASEIHHAVISYAGTSDGAALGLHRAIPVTGCVFSDWAGVALMAPASALDEYAEDNTFVDMEDDDLMPL